MAIVKYAPIGAVLVLLAFWVSPEMRASAAGPITAPANVTVSGTTSTSVSLTWSASTDSSGTGDVPAYHVMNGTNIVATSMGTTVTVSSLTPSTSYTLSVEAYDVAGNTSGLSSPVSATTQSSSGGLQKAAYYEQWGVYGNAYYPSTFAGRPAASSVTTLLYAFENVDPTNLTCFETIKASDSTNESDPNAGDGAGDAFADYQKSFANGTSVDGSNDSFSQPIKGNFNQLRELKVRFPSLKILVSLGGWTYSKFFSDVAASPASRQKFVSSCIDMFLKGNLPTGVSGDASGGPAATAGVFDGFDIDWEYPASNGGHLGNHSSPSDTQNFTLLLQEFRTELDAYGQQTGRHFQLTAALPAGQDKISLIQTNQIGQFLDFGDIMTYDFHGGFETTGPTNFASQLQDSPNDPMNPVAPGHEKYNADTAITAWTSGLSDYGIPGGFPASKIDLGIPFYWRGWTGVATGANHGLYQAATGPSSAFNLSQTAGTAFWNELESAGLTGNSSDNFTDPTTHSPWIYDGSNFYTGDTAQSIAVKDQYVQSHGLAGAFAYALKDDDAQATLLSAMVGGLSGAAPPTPTPSSSPTPTPTPTSTPTPTPTGTPTPTPTPTPTTQPTPTPTPTPGGSLVANPGFESGSLGGWSCSPADSVVTNPVHSGTHALAAAANNTDNAQCTQTLTVRANTTYTLSAWVEGAYAFLGVSGTGTNDTSAWTPSTTSWQQLSTSFTTGASTTSVTIFVHGWYGQGTIFADDVSVT